MASRVGVTMFRKSFVEHMLQARCYPATGVGSSILNTVGVRCAHAGSKTRGQPKNKGVPGYRIGVTKGLDSHHTGSLAGSYWAADRLADDIMIRKFVEGVFYNQLNSDIVIKRKNNLINIVFLISELEESDLTKFYFKVGFSEKLLTELLSCIVTLDAQTKM